MADLRRPASLGLLAWGLVWGCGSTEAQWPVQTAPPYTYSKYASELPEFYCDRLMDCPSADASLMRESLLFGSIDKCITVISADFADPRRFDASSDIKSGRIRFHADAARAYLDHLSRDCDSSVLAADPYAGGGLEGTLDTGASCQVSVECKNGNYCDHANGACPGTCTAKKADGSPCQSGTECASEYCGAESTCDKLTLAPLAAAGDPCGLASGSNPVETLCGAGLWCDGRPAGHCRKPIPADAPCNAASDLCVGGHLCLTDVDGMKRCRPVAVVGKGELCTGENSPDVRICDSLSYLACEQSSCTGVSASNEGAACIPGDFGDSCDTGLYCDSATRLCQKLGQAGDPCTAGAGCASGYCISGTGTCSGTFCD